MKSQQAITSKWSKNGQGLVQNWVDGITSVVDNPMVKAANRADAMLAGVTEAVTSGRWANKLRNKPITDWSGPTVAKKQNYVAGFTGPGLNKYTSFVSSIYQTWQQSHQASVAARQSGVGSTARFLANANALRAWAGKGPID